jgi:trimeric autotransporter adhesin
MSTINVNEILPVSGDFVDVNGIKTIANNSNIRLSVDGSASNLSGQDNVIIGKSNGSPTGNENVVIGKGAVVTQGTSNVLIGSVAGQGLVEGSSNVCVGNQAGASVNGFNNTFVGSFSGSGGFPSTGVNNTCIGNGSVMSSSSASYEITLGGNVTTALRCAATTITSLSDARDKKEIEELPVGLEFIKGLKPVKFVWDDRDEKGRHDVKDFGFIAQDLKKVQEDIELADTLKLVYESNPDKLEASYGKLVPILVKAIQELSTKVTELEDNLNK